MWELDNFRTLFLNYVLPSTCSYTLQGFLHITGVLHGLSHSCTHNIQAYFAVLSMPLYTALYAPQESQIHFSPVDIKCQNPAGFGDVNAFSPLSLRSLSRNHLTLDTGYVIILNKLPKERENEQFFNHFSSSAKLELYTDFSIFSVCVLSVCLLLRDSNTVGVTVVLKKQPFHKITDFTM